ncbi:MAG: ABC transporter permease [Nitrospiraceae bacterium]|nr:ABC transporter permease [Nitrospiraceae bacterium]
MFMWLTISLRNILKNGRRSLMTVLAIALGYAAINLFQGYVHSTYEGLTNAAIHGEGLGHFAIFRKGYLEQGKLHPEKFQFSKEEVDRISAIVCAERDVQLVTPRLSVSGILSNGKNSTIFISEGLVPAEDVEIRGDLSKYTSFTGSYLDERERTGVVIGAELAAMLDLKVGSDAVILSNTYTGMANALDAKVLGIYNTGNTATNDKMLLMTYRHAQDLVDYSGAERLIVLLRDGRNGKNLAAVMERLRKSISDAGYDVEMKTWNELSVFYRQVKNLFDMIFLFIFLIVLVIVVMSVVNTMSMSVMERTREIGTLRALGLKRFGVKSLFATEGALLGILGSAAGSIIFFLVYAAITAAHPTYIPPGSSNPVPLRVDLVWSVLVRSVLSMTVLALVAAYIPAKRSAKMTIVDALGHI